MLPFWDRMHPFQAFRQQFKRRVQIALLRRKKKVSASISELTEPGPSVLTVYIGPSVMPLIILSFGLLMFSQEYPAWKTKITFHGSLCVFLDEHIYIAPAISFKRSVFCRCGVYLFVFLHYIFCPAFFWLCLGYHDQPADRPFSPAGEKPFASTVLKTAKKVWRSPPVSCKVQKI